MKCFYRYIDNIQISIIIENELYEEHKLIFDSLFITFLDYQKKGFFNNYLYYIYKSKNNLNEIIHNYKISDSADNDWIFSLINDLENFYADILNCTVLHGSCIQIEGKNILLIGERWSGKTTLTQYLTIDMKCGFVSDDCIYLLNNMLIGFGMPLPVRGEKIDNTYKDFFIGATVDSDGTNRILYAPTNIVERVFSVDSVIFSKYVESKNANIIKLKSGEALERLIRNVRSKSTMSTLFNDMVRISKLSDCYVMQYPSCNIAYEMILGVIFDEK